MEAGYSVHTFPEKYQEIRAYAAPWYRCMEAGCSIHTFLLLKHY
jgi:hypothetical protein